MHATTRAGTTPTIRPETRPGGPSRPVVIEGQPSRGIDDMFMVGYPIGFDLITFRQSFSVIPQGRSGRRVHRFHRRFRNRVEILCLFDKFQRR